MTTSLNQLSTTTLNNMIADYSSLVNTGGIRRKRVHSIDFDISPKGDVKIWFYRVYQGTRTHAPLHAYYSATLTARRMVGKLSTYYRNDYLTTLWVASNGNVSVSIRRRPE